MEFGIRYYKFSATLFKSVWIAETSLPPAMAMSDTTTTTCYDRRKNFDKITSMYIAGC